MESIDVSGKEVTTEREYVQVDKEVVVEKIVEKEVRLYGDPNEVDLSDEDVGVDVDEDDEENQDALSFEIESNKDSFEAEPVDGEDRSNIDQSMGGDGSDNGPDVDSDRESSFVGEAVDNDEEGDDAAEADRQGSFGSFGSFGGNNGMPEASAQDKGVDSARETQIATTEVAKKSDDPNRGSSFAGPRTTG